MRHSRDFRIFHLLWRFCRAMVLLVVFPVIGAVLSAAIGACEGAVVGMPVGLVAPVPEGFLPTLGACATIGAVFGCATGLLTFGLIILGTLEAPDPGQLFRRAIERAALTSIYGVALGAAIGFAITCGTLMVLWFMDQVATRHGVIDTLVTGSGSGAIVGFLIGFMVGASRGGQTEAQMQQLQAEIDRHIKTAHANR